MLVLILLLLWPIVEIAGFIVVGREIGVLTTIALIFAGGMLGAALMRYQGFGVLTRIQKEVEAGGHPGRELAHGVMILVAGMLLLLPGFVSDIVGLMLFLPPVRDLAWRFLRKRVNFAEIRVARSARRSDRSGPTIDLDESDYSSGPNGGTPNPGSPWRRIEPKDGPDRP